MPGNDLGRIALLERFCDPIGSYRAELRLPPAAAVPASVTERPGISLRVSGGQDIVPWQKAGMEALEIQVDRGDGRWVHLATDTRPDYLDATPWPTPPQT